VTYPGYPLTTEKLGDFAAEVQAFAEWADPRLPGLGVEVVTGHYTTNNNGDFAQTFSRITNVQAIVCPAFLNQTSPPLWVQLAVPVTMILPGSPPDTLWVRVYAQAPTATPLANQPVQVCFYAWGVPK
jgi:hypothetical protein